MIPTLYLAPLHGVTGSMVRNSLYKHFTGIDAAMAPFINSINSETAYAKGRGNHFKDLLAIHNPKGKILIPQILSNEGASFIETAKTIEGLGYTEVNWNLGCPFPMVTAKKRGSGLLPFPDLIEKFLTEACAKVDIQISVKVRLGLNSPSEILALMPIFNAFPIKKIIIHPRIGTQMYTGTVDLEGFAKAAAMSAHAVMYNGDIRDESVFETLQARFPLINEWMIGRWAMYNPFIFSQIKKTPLPENPAAAIRAFHDDLYSRYREILFGPKHVLDKMKEIWTYLGRSFTGASRLLLDISQAKTLESYEKTIDAIFSKTAWTGLPK